MTDISNGVAFIRRLLEQAKSNKASDEEQRCLQLALIPMQALYDIALTSQNNMKTAYASGDGVHADLEYRKILVAQTKTQQFMAKAMLCVGNPPGTTNSITESNVTGNADALPDASMEVDPEAKVPLAGTPF